MDSSLVKPNGLESSDIELASQTRSAHGEPLLLEDDEPRNRSWIKIAVVSLALIACFIRLIAADRLTLWVDEPVSMLAAFEVADTGVPVLPSGKLYLQGATLSYILVPVVLAGYDELGDYPVLRLPSVFVGTAAVVALFFLTRYVTGSILGGFLAGLLLAVDPSSVRWSSYVRMYALLQLCSILLIWLFLDALLKKPSRWRLVALVGVFWFGVFSQVAIVLFLPAMALCALLTCGKSLLNRRRDLVITLGACMVAPLVFVGVNRLVTPPGLDPDAASIDADFVGAHILSFQRLFDPTLDSWHLLFRGTRLLEVVPAIVFGASCLLAGRYFMGPLNSRGARSRRRLVGIALMLYWIPIAIVGTFSSLQQPRYLIHIQPVGYLIITLLVLDFAVGWQALDTTRSNLRNPSVHRAAISMTAATAIPSSSIAESALTAQGSNKNNGRR